MSEQPTATATRPPRAPGKTYAGLTRNQWLITGGVFVAVLGYIIWKRRQAGSAAATTAPTNQGSNACTDANGNPVDCNEQFAQELAAMQNALDQLGAGSGAGGSTGGGGFGTTGTSGATNGTASGTTTTQPAATPTTSTGSTAASGGTATKTKTAGPVTGLSASAVTKTSFRASWHAAANAQSYRYVVRDLASHSQVSDGQTSGTSVTVSGLRSGVDYNFGIQALPGGLGDNIHVRTK